MNATRGCFAVRVGRLSKAINSRRFLFFCSVAEENMSCPKQAGIAVSKALEGQRDTGRHRMSCLSNQSKP